MCIRDRSHPVQSRLPGRGSPADPDQAEKLGLSERPGGWDLRPQNPGRSDLVPEKERARRRRHSRAGDAQGHGDLHLLGRNRRERQFQRAQHERLQPPGPADFGGGQRLSLIHIFFSPSSKHASLLSVQSLTPGATIARVMPFQSVPLLKSLDGNGISTVCASTTPFGLALAPDYLEADEPSFKNLRFSAIMILT